MGHFLVVGKQFIGSSPAGTPFSILGVHAHSLTMERILEGWSRFSLSDKEGWVRLEKKQQTSDSNEVVLAAKFLNKRVLNVDAIGRTFRAVWKTRKSFDIR